MNQMTGLSDRRFEPAQPAKGERNVFEGSKVLSGDRRSDVRRDDGRHSFDHER
jgi:hypothetical protein